MVESASYVHLVPRRVRLSAVFCEGSPQLASRDALPATVGPLPMTPEEVARDYDISVEVVQRGDQLLQSQRGAAKNEREEDWKDSRTRGLLAAWLTAQRRRIHKVSHDEDRVLDDDSASGSSSQATEGRTRRIDPERPGYCRGTRSCSIPDASDRSARILLTRNSRDFKFLHATGASVRRAATTESCWFTSIMTPRAT